MIETLDPGASRARTRAEIVDVAAGLLRAGGAGAVTTRAVAAGARVQAPTIYRLFDDKDCLLDAVAERVFATYVEGKALADETDDPVADLRAAWDTHINFGLANPDVFAILSDPKRASRSPSAAAGRDILGGRVHRLAASGRLQVPEERAVAMIHAAGTGVIVTQLAVAPSDRDPGLAAAVFDTLLRGISSRAPVGPGGNVVAMVVALRAVAPGITVLTDAERLLFIEWLDRLGAGVPGDLVGPAGRRVATRSRRRAG
jgi:AcrR family transcriptional regulator